MSTSTWERRPDATNWVGRTLQCMWRGQTLAASTIAEIPLTPPLMASSTNSSMSTELQSQPFPMTCWIWAQCLVHHADFFLVINSHWLVHRETHVSQKMHRYEGGFKRYWFCWVWWKRYKQYLICQSYLRLALIIIRSWNRYLQLQPLQWVFWSHFLSWLPARSQRPVQD